MLRLNFASSRILADKLASIAEEPHFIPNLFLVKTE